MIAIVTWLWRGERDYRAEHANVLGAMLRRHMTVPFRLICITDEPGDFDAGVEALPTPPAAAALAALKTPEGGRFPSSYRRLWLFSAEARTLAPRVLLTDIDVVVTGDLAPLVDRDDDFVGWRPGQSWGNDKHRLAGGTWLLRTGSKTAVWDDFAGPPSIAEARRAGYRGSDQAWISYKLNGTVPVWPAGSGIYSIRDMTRDDRRVRTDAPPADARVVHFNGRGKPWDGPTADQHPWVREHYR